MIHSFGVDQRPRNQDLLAFGVRPVAIPIARSPSGEVAEGKRKKGEEDEEDEGDEVWQEGKRLEDFLLQTVISFDFNYCK